jgi:SAM-dependent methyltransferase
MLAVVLTVLVPALAAGGEPPGGRVFPASRFSIDEALRRPDSPEVPFGSVGRRLWASSPRGWAFRDDVHFLGITNLKAFDLEIVEGDARLGPARGTWYPSHVALEGLRRVPAASASYTFPGDNVAHPLGRPFLPAKRWTCWGSGRREDWYAVDFGRPRTLQGLRLWFFDDAPTGGCRPPEAVTVQVWNGDRWADAGPSAKPVKGENTLSFAPVQTAKVRLVFKNAGNDFYTGLYGFEPVGPPEAGDGSDPAALSVKGVKCITDPDVLFSQLELDNPTPRPRSLTLRLVLPEWPSPEYHLTKKRPTDRLFEHCTAATRLHDIPVRFALNARVTSDLAVDEWVVEDVGSNNGQPVICRLRLTVPPGKQGRLLVAMAVLPEGEDAAAAVSAALDPAGDPLARHVAAYQAWFDRNIAYFECSDPDITKIYYHRWYVLRKNLMDPRVGRLRWKTFTEGRWRVNWYPHVISYGGGHQIREARWLADPSYWQDHLRTYAHNERPDGLYPNRVLPVGPKEGQYTDWITASALDGHKLHPDRKFLEEVADKLAANARGWQKVYGLKDNHLLFVDSHWWTGMEWQPSFFYFSDWKTDPKERSMPRGNTPLARVDLTAYNYGNARAVARIYELLGQNDRAAEFQRLAAGIKKDLQELMWHPGGGFFYSLRAADLKRADVKEVVGIYPFYFDLPDPGRGYERAWDSILDPEQFWTPWPVASVSKQCPAYSQTGWPHDQASGTACMWNGPSWPHANSVVMTAMANTLRHYPPCNLKREHLWRLFQSFTRVQFKDGQPWTGEYYNGLTGEWKTGERDYNHSTYADILLGDLLGIVPRSDDVLEIDPLLPEGALDRFVLDGQAYHGHRLSLRWDKGRPAAERFEVYVDGRRVAAADRLKKLFIDLKTGKELDSAPAGD